MTAFEPECAYFEESVGYANRRTLSEEIGHRTSVTAVAGGVFVRAESIRGAVE